jgi:hypothetical protein
MTPGTYRALPSDVRDGLGDSVTLDESIPDGQVRVYGEGGSPRDVPVNAFVRARRAVHKRERQNRKAGRR